MDFNRETIHKRIVELTQEGAFLHKFVSGAQKEIYKVAKNNTDQAYETDIRKGAYSYDLMHKANDFLYVFANNEPGAKPDIFYNRASHSHTVVEINNVVLTISLVNSSNEKPRKSKFRSRFTSSLNPDLFDSSSMLITPDQKIYATITHGPISQKERDLGFMFIGVLDSTGKEYVYHKDLFKLCSVKHKYELELKVPSKREQKQTDKPSIKLKDNTN